MARAGDDDRDAPCNGRNQALKPNHPSDRVRWSELLNRQYASSVALVCLGVWLHAADGLVVATMLPSIIPSIGGEGLVAWTVAIYEIGSIVAGAASGLLAVRKGIRRPMMWASLIFGAGCVISAVAPNMPVMLGGRALQGLGGGLLTGMSFVAVAVLFPARLVARAIAAISAFWGVSAFLGPLVGGIFATYSSWRFGFLFFGGQAALLAAWILFGARLLEQPREEGDLRRFPVIRLMLLSSGVILISYAGLEIDRIWTPTFLAAGLATIAGFIFLDRKRYDSRLLPTNILDVRLPVNASLFMIFLLHVATSGLITYGPFLLAVIHGASAITAGYVLASVSIGWTVSAVAVSGAPERHDSYYIAGGVLLVVGSVIGLLFSVPNGSLALIFVFAWMEGIGQGSSRAFIVRRAIGMALPSDKERTSAAIPFVARLGYALGAAACGMLANAAGFTAELSNESAVTVAYFIFVGMLPFALLGLFAMVAMLALHHRRSGA